MKKDTPSRKLTLGTVIILVSSFVILITNPIIADVVKALLDEVVVYSDYTMLVGVVIILTTLYLRNRRSNRL